ncbi:hypothetical protein BRO17_09455 [Xanthomonas oryzae pv. oryzae]|nr:hypothetical protein BRN17_04990 [Xanthomonas oryzae pv. oryzae]RBK45235.1 hypothetical protein BRO17_09455 [Xanthomonas oryzae pv. oryzae]
MFGQHTGLFGRQCAAFGGACAGQFQRQHTHGGYAVFGLTHDSRLAHHGVEATLRAIMPARPVQAMSASPPCQVNRCPQHVPSPFWAAFVSRFAVRTPHTRM